MTRTPTLKFIPTFVSSVLQPMKILFSCEDFSEKSFASLIHRARARRRARAREAMKPYLFGLWMVGMTAKKQSNSQNEKTSGGRTKLPLSHL
jgi:hypothetical protein